VEILLAESNFFTGQIPSEIGRWINATVLNLADNDLRGGIPQEVANLPLVTNGLLQLLNISSNVQLTGTIPEPLCNVSEGFSFLYDCTDSLCGCECSCFNSTNMTTLNFI
jgi:hypothetical protein